MLSSWLSANWIMYRKALAFGRLVRLPCSRAVQAAPGLKKLTAFFVAMFQLFGALVFDWPTAPDGPTIDMSKFELVWSDEFDGSALDTDRWGGHYVYSMTHSYHRDNSWWHMGQVSVQDGCLAITAEYKDGVRGPDFYTCGIDTSPNHVFYPTSTGYEQRYGYFEIRCKFPDAEDVTPAFWMLCEGMFQNNASGVGGAEIDVFETYTNSGDKHYRNSVFQTIHVGGYENPNHKNQNVGHFYVGDPYVFNTYGVEWNEKEYIFYINGQETARTDFAGPCQVPMYLIVSLGVGDNAKAEQLPVEFLIDYVRAYQYK